MTDPAMFLSAPLGQPGSGRVRYGAAMALFTEGHISAEVLEVYRVASAHDGRDPLAILQERGLPAPPRLAALTPLVRLYHAAREYLRALDHPGKPEVMTRLPADPGPAASGPNHLNPVVQRWLQPALDVVALDQPELAAAITAARDALEWTTYDAYPGDQIGQAFATGHAFASIVGEAAPFPARDYDMGLFLIGPGILYRDHAHKAPELYAPLTGPHGWRFGVERPLMTKPAHDPVWNPPYRPHLTKVGRVPFLGLYAWTKDVNDPAVVLPATDWAALEETDLA